FGGGGGIWFPSIVVVALGEPNSPVTCWACAVTAASDTPTQNESSLRIASPEMFPEAEMLPHLICSRPMFIGGAKDEADQHGGARRVGGSDSRAVCARGPG